MISIRTLNDPKWLPDDRQMVPWWPQMPLYESQMIPIWRLPFNTAILKTEKFGKEKLQLKILLYRKRIAAIYDAIIHVVVLIFTVLKHFQLYFFFSKFCCFKYLLFYILLFYTFLVTPRQEGYCNHNICLSSSVNILVITIALPFFIRFL